MRRACLLLFTFIFAVVLFGFGGCVPVAVERDSQESAPAWAKVTEFGSNFGVICSQQNVGLWVTGEGKVTAAPDVVLLRLGIESEAKTVAEAQSNATGVMGEVVKRLKSNGVSEKDIQTQRFSIYATRKWIKDEEREQIIGYRVTNIVNAKIRQMDKAGTIIDAVAEAGGDLTRIENISFTVDEPAPYYREARDKAIDDAMTKAKQIAKVAEVKLGKPIYISEGATYDPPMRDAYKMEAVASGVSATPISPGELEFYLTIQMVYEID